uniref:Uncharacterized protein n=1 Tax=Phaeomonas parva TaxID=124430 RepID=A0A7S1TTY7_9STRA
MAKLGAGAARMPAKLGEVPAKLGEISKQVSMRLRRRPLGEGEVDERDYVDFDEAAADGPVGAGAAVVSLDDARARHQRARMNKRDRHIQQEGLRHRTGAYRPPTLPKKQSGSLDPTSPMHNLESASAATQTTPRNPNASAAPAELTSPTNAAANPNANPSPNAPARSLNDWAERRRSGPALKRDHDLDKLRMRRAEAERQLRLAQRRGEELWRSMRILEADVRLLDAEMRGLDAELARLEQSEA